MRIEKRVMRSRVVRSVARLDLQGWLKWGAEELAFLGKDEALAECEEVLETLLGVSRFELYLTSEADPLLFSQYTARIRDRKKRIPLAYLLRKTCFWEDCFDVEKGVFIPRPETETLIEAFLRTGPYAPSDPFSFLDFGTGSGNIAITIAKLFPRAHGIASDLSAKALDVATRNAKRLGVDHRIQGVEADGLGGFKPGSLDVIFSNPPYVASGEWEELAAEVREEPRLALEGGEDGLDFYRGILESIDCLRKKGSLWVEIGRGEHPAVVSLFRTERFARIEVFKDLSGIDRVVAGREFRG